MLGLTLENPATTESKLAALGLTLEECWAAILTGEAARNAVTVDHPPVSGGFRSWDDTFAALMRTKRPDDWRKFSWEGLPLVVSPAGIAIAIVPGTYSTGTALEPTTERPAKKIKSLITDANRQLVLFPSLRSPDLPAPGLAIRQCWLLLRYRQGDTVRAELSLPGGLDDSGRVGIWMDRIRLGELQISSGEDVPPPEPTDNIEIVVTRRE